ncbi:glycogen debranching protein GlgX [Mobilicoccus pelagius]|uniref:Glycogen debranching enzyme n=1 Tax=Mobilicoccus pelagius NBRC 104925 TaxID=1089455 RepID=H5UQN8_9MICO|nr:glycogen debranching protein GlgX [Mobilicoccus pelagius]GAB48046.1 glycogen debranching enzyme [Mobilicoccus pelagius NBRC 104925]
MRPHLDVAPPLGATPDEDGTTFALFAAHAEAVELCLFDTGDADGTSEWRVPMTDRVHHVWSVHVPGVGPGQRYGFRVHGPWRPEAGLRHNPAKLLLDPYGRAVDGRPRWSPELFGHEVDAEFTGSPEVRDDRDSAGVTARSVVISPDTPRPRPVTRVSWTDTVIYEAHVRGATVRHPGIPEELRGTYAGLAHPAFVAHLRDLGVTTLELMPVHAFMDERHLAQRGMRNYWGYNTLSFFAPHPDYAVADDPQGAVAEFRTMVDTLHANGIEILLDVVYNHTCEQGDDGPTVCWRGIDASSYYRMDGWGRGVDVTGCGNTLDLRDPYVCGMVLDSLRYWAGECGVDGFRYDLGVALARGPADDYNPDHPFFVALRTDPLLRGLKHVAEPWDVGMHGWRTGQFPPPFAEWNDRFRDTVRTFWLSDVATSSANGHGVRELATRLSGSQDLFDAGDRGPSASVNYVASHDGYALADTTAYERKHNEPNGEHNRDGHGDNRAWNHGVEGLTDDPEVLARRRRSVRNLLATTILSTGTPMLCAGDEFGRTQRGNNNAYCQDNDTSWLDWEHGPSQRGLLATTRFLLGLRRQHRAFRQHSFFTPTPRWGDDAMDVLWYGRYGEEMTAASWEDPRCRVLQMLLVGDDIDAASLLLVFQGKADEEEVRLPPLPGEGRGYTLLWDSTWEHPEPPAGETTRHSPGDTVRLAASSMWVLLADRR